MIGTSKIWPGLRDESSVTCKQRVREVKRIKNAKKGNNVSVCLASAFSLLRHIFHFWILRPHIDSRIKWKERME